MQWAIEVDRKERLITADQPVVIWKAPSPRDRFEGVGVQTADAVRQYCHKLVIGTPRTSTVIDAPSGSSRADR
jgi:hypothetical protein